MVKIKSTETLSLDVSKQKRVRKQTENIKKKIETGEIKIHEDKKDLKVKAEQKRGLIYVGHLPHGFYEDEIRNYFKQFGNVTNAMVCRSRKTGGSKGYGYVEFAHPDVAKIAAETMNNYLMFKKRVVANFVPYEKRPPHLFHGRASSENVFTSKLRRQKQVSTKNKIVTDVTHLKKSRATLKKLSKKMEKLQKMGINCELQPQDCPEMVETDVTPVSIKVSPVVSDVELKKTVKKRKVLRNSLEKNQKIKSLAKKIKVEKSSSTKSLKEKKPKTKAVTDNKKTEKNIETIKKSKSKNVENSKSEKKTKSKNETTPQKGKKKEKGKSSVQPKKTVEKKVKDVKKEKKQEKSPKSADKKEKRPLRSKKESNSKPLTNSKLSGITKKTKQRKLVLNESTVKKIAKELVKNNKDSLVNIKKPAKKSFKK